MKTYQIQKYNDRMTVVSGLVILVAFVVTMTNVNSRTTLPLAVMWFIGLGAVTGMWKYLDTITPVVMYLYGFIVPSVAVLSFDHDGSLILIAMMLSVVGVALYGTTVQRFGSWWSGVIGFGLGVVLSSVVVA